MLQFWLPLLIISILTFGFVILSSLRASRLLMADEGNEASEEKAPLSAGPKAALFALIGAGFVGAMLLYSAVGVPGLDDLPLAKRAELERPSQERALALIQAEGGRQEVEIDAQTSELMEQLEGALKERPDDAEGWRLLARSSHNLGRFVRAYEAQERYIELVGDKARAEDYTLLAEAYIFAVNGYVSPKAEEAVRAALMIDRGNLAARFYAAMTLRQEGEVEKAGALFEGLLQEGVEDAALREEITRQLGEIRRASGPDAEELAKAADMSEAERQEMIGGMVDGLKARLANEGGQASEWARLIRALRVLERHDEASKVLSEALEKFAGVEEIEALRE